MEDLEFVRVFVEQVLVLVVEALVDLVLAVQVLLVQVGPPQRVVVGLEQGEEVVRGQDRLGWASTLRTLLCLMIGLTWYGCSYRAFSCSALFGFACASFWL